MRTEHSRRAARFLAVSPLVAAALTSFSMAPNAARAAPAPIPVLGNVPAAVATAEPLGPAPGSQRLSLQVDLPLRNFARLEAAIANLSDPSSPGFQRFLTPPQLTARYGPTAAQLGVVESYLRSAGIAIASVSPQRNMIDASATVNTADRAFGVRIWRWRGAGGRHFYAPRGNPVLPASVARLVLAISGLDNLGQLKPDTVTCTTDPPGGAPAGTCAEPGGASNLGYSPAQVQQAYTVRQLARSGLCGAGPALRCDGTGQNIGILEFGTSWAPADESKFDSQYGLKSPKATAKCPQGVQCPGPDISGGGVIEADLDVEVAHAIAPGAQVIAYETPKDLMSGLGDLLTTMLNQKVITTTNSISYGTCEGDFGSSQAYATHQQFAMLAARGEVFFVASGDSGKYCQSGPNVTAPAYPASDPLVTSVGGTNLLLNSDGSYAYEYAWSESGGGSSTYSWNTRPRWQVGPGIPTVSTRRLVPDVSAAAFCSLTAGCVGTPGYDYDVTGPGTGYPTAALGYSEYTYCSPTTQCWISNGGTSAATPLWAAVAALYNQYAVVNEKTQLNANVNAQLYNLAFKDHRYAGAITDITYQAENGSDLYQNAGTGWDGATGVGSPEVYSMVRDLPGLAITPGAGPPATAVAVSGTSFLPGETVTARDASDANAAVCHAVAASDGSFHCSGAVPGTAAYGQQQIVATGKTSAEKALSVFDAVANTGYAYVANEDGTVTPISIATNTAGTPISVGGEPWGIAVTPNGATVYVANYGDNTVTPISTATNTAGTPIPVGSQPKGIAITPNGATVYVANSGGHTVTPISTATNTAGTPIHVGTYAESVAITPNGAMAYVTNYGSDTVTPISTATNTAGKPIPVGVAPEGIAITPNGATAYVTNSNDDTVTPISTATNTAGTPIPVSNDPFAVAITPNGSTAYIANILSGTVTPISTATNTAGTPIHLGGYPAGLAITPDGATAYVTNSNDDTVTPISTAADTAGTPILVGFTPVGVATSYDGGY
jgi:YVTN family beta-propeller protein